MQTTLADVDLAADQCAALRGDDALRQFCLVTPARRNKLICGGKQHRCVPGFCH